MARRTQAELLEITGRVLGERTDDEALSLLEDIRDTVVDKVPETDWEQKYRELDAEWRKRYRETFMSGQSTDNPAEVETETTVLDSDEKSKTVTYDDLFKKEGE